MKLPVAVFALILVLIPSLPAHACKPKAGYVYRPPPSLTEQDYQKGSIMIVFGRVTAFQAMPTDFPTPIDREYRFTFTVDYWLKGSGPQTLTLYDTAHQMTDCDFNFHIQQRQNLANAYSLRGEPFSGPNADKIIWKVYIVKDKGHLRVWRAIHPIMPVRPAQP